MLLLEEPDFAKREHLARVLQGVRHVSGIRQWGPYQQAEIVAMMIDNGRDQADICEIFGLPKRRINILRRCYYALDQMRRDDDFGDQVKPSLFSTFDEIFKLPRVRDWLEWDDEQNTFSQRRTAEAALFMARWVRGRQRTTSTTENRRPEGDPKAPATDGGRDPVQAIR